MSGKIDAWQGDLSSVPRRQWDVVVVNILAHVIIDLLDRSGLLTYVKPGGYLILSGIIDQQQPDVETAVHAASGALLDRLHRRDWVTLVAQPDSVSKSF